MSKRRPKIELKRHKIVRISFDDYDAIMAWAKDENRTFIGMVKTLVKESNRTLPIKML